MRIVFDRGDLRLDVTTGDVLHADALEVWSEARTLSATCLDVLPEEAVGDTCELLAKTATYALAAGRDNKVMADFWLVKRRIRDADQDLRRKIVDRGFVISLICAAVGLLAGIVWITLEPYRPWNLLPTGHQLWVNYTLLVLGWSGFTLVGFSIGWLFLITAVVRNQDPAGVIKQDISLRQRKAHVFYNALLCLLIVIAMFFFGGFEKINKILSEQLISAPWAILLGLVASVAETVLFERIRGFFVLS